MSAAAKILAILAPYYCTSCDSEHTALEPCNDLGTTDIEAERQRIVEEITNDAFFQDPPTWPDFDVTCPACLGDGEGSEPTPAHYRSSDIDTVPCGVCGGKGTIGRRED